MQLEISQKLATANQLKIQRCGGYACSPKLELRRSAAARRLFVALVPSDGGFGSRGALGRRPGAGWD